MCGGGIRTQPTNQTRTTTTDDGIRNNQRKRGINDQRRGERRETANGRFTCIPDLDTISMDSKETGRYYQITTKDVYDRNRLYSIVR